MTIECELGFQFDRRYKRKFELEGLIEKRNIGIGIGMKQTYFLERIANIFPSKIVKKLEKIFEFQMVLEDTQRFVEIEKNIKRNKVILNGYWQSHLYFKEYEKIVVDEITSWLTMEKSKIRLNSILSQPDEESVAIGVRTYSESKDPDFHARDRLTKSLSDWQTAINVLKDKIDNPVFYLYTIDKEKVLENLEFGSSKVIFVDQQNIESSKARLLSFASCTHHIFNNSSFYWWGAYLSPHLFPSRKKLVYASNNFLNVNSHPQIWHSF